MKKLLLLNTSIVVKKPIFSRDTVKIEYGDKRIQSYIKGLEALNNIDIINNFDDIYIFDNTVNNQKSMPKEIINVLPEEAKYFCNKNNKVGRKNKGAGMLETLQNNSKELLNFEKLFYFEPRLVINDSNFINEFLLSDKNYFSIESDKRVKTGYFGSNTYDLIQFLESTKVKNLIDKNLHIELLMYDFYANKSTEFFHKNISIWKNYLTGVYEPY